MSGDHSRRRGIEGQAEKQKLFALYRLAAKLGFSPAEIMELKRTYGSAFTLEDIPDQTGDGAGSASK